MKTYYIYIMASRRRALYIGMTSNLRRRVNQHKLGTGSSHAAKYRIDRLVYYESFNLVTDAIQRETQLKGWRREKKVRLIQSVNPFWEELEIPFEGVFHVRT